MDAIEQPLNPPSWKRRVLGLSLLVLGVLGVVLPVLQGTIFLMLGLFVLRDQYGWSRRWLGWFARRWPRQMNSLDALERKMLLKLRGWTGRLRGLLSRSRP